MPNLIHVYAGLKVPKKTPQAASGALTKSYINEQEATCVMSPSPDEHIWGWGRDGSGMLIEWVQIDQLSLLG